MMMRLLILGLLFSLPALAFDDPFDSLPEGPGREAVGAHCGACHSLNLVTQQGDTREGWAEVLQWMVDDHGMLPLDSAEEELILDYLAEHFSREGQKERLQNRGIIR